LFNFGATYNPPSPKTDKNGNRSMLLDTANSSELSTPQDERDHLKMVNGNRSFYSSQTKSMWHQAVQQIVFG